MTAPPTPCRPRARLRKVGSGASAQSSEATEKIAEADREDAAAAEPVGERAGGEDSAASESA